MKFVRAAVILLVVCSAVDRACAISIVLDYTYDTFFASHPTAKATLEDAAQDLSNTITSTLGATTDMSSGTFGSATVNYDFAFTFKNPTTGAAQTLDPAVLPANQFRIYVGVRNLTGNTLGIGGPGGVGLQGSDSYVNQNDVPAAVQIATAAANSNMGRGSGPIVGQLTGSFGLSNTSFAVNYGSGVGNLWFDVDSNNDGIADSDAVLNNYWQFDRNQPVGATQNDFYSVALHEMMHSLGFGTSASWNSLIASPSNNWLGSQVISLEGTGSGVLAGDDDHVAQGLLSTRLSDGGSQEAVMEPSLEEGTRRTLTRLDLAFLRDIGWQTVAYPLLEGDFNQDNRRSVADVQAMMAALANLSGYEQQHNLTNAQMLSIGDIDGDHAITNRDLQALIDLIANDGSQSLQLVPEPGSLFLMAGGGLWLFVGLGLATRQPREAANVS